MDVICKQSGEPAPIVRSVVSLDDGGREFGGRADRWLVDNAQETGVSRAVYTGRDGDLWKFSSIGAKVRVSPGCACQLCETPRRERR